MSKPPSETSDDIEELTLFNLPFAQEVKRCGTPPNTELPDEYKDKVRNTPIARTENGAKGGFQSKDAKSRNTRYAREMKKWCVGPMPVEDFLDEFLPTAPEHKGPMPDWANAFDDVPVNPPKEPEIYPKLAINDNKRCPTLTFVDTSNRAESPGLGSLKPDICAYDKYGMEILKKEVEEKPKRKGKESRFPAHFGFAELFIEVKKTEKADLFEDPKSNGEPSKHNFIVVPTGRDNRAKALEDLGQIVSYATEACARQHRTSYFSVSIAGSLARLIRWDRAGAIVTGSFDYKKNPKLLCEFLWRYGCANAAHRGYDTSVTMASEEEETFFRETISAHVAFQLDVAGGKLKKAVGQHYQKGRVAKVDVFGKDEHGVPVNEQYLISRPVVSPLSMAGRSTRGYWAAKVGSEHKIAFLKDTWRIDVERMEREGAILQRLHLNGVKNVPGLYCHGDVPVDVVKAREEMSCELELPQCTRTNEFVDAPWACNYGRKMKVTKHTHYRLVLKTVGYSLKDFKGTREMFETTHDAYEALIDAYIKCHMLHRDVSVNNVILVRDPVTGRRRGILIDWELSTLADDNGQARDYHRSGTWAFMSTEALHINPRFRHKIQDDMESMLYVVLYCCVRWLPHNKVENLGHKMYKFFDQYDSEDGNIIVGGGDKDGQKLARRFTQLFNFEDIATRFWINLAFDYLAPMGSDYLKYKDKWTPKSFNELWVAILRYTLPESDRTEHVVSDKHEGSSSKHNATQPSSTRFSEEYEEPVKEQVRSSKRSLSDAFEDAVEENAGGSKRHRLTPVAEYDPGTRGGGSSEPFSISEWVSELHASIKHDSEKNHSSKSTNS
ncbi:hypothetical protein DFH11DRAFT_1854205 [Phellopilus nigrolimitatus]|nr:hypothetical protein DFH11DRAFT_1854205 [Phellopilus nigrolimitatus]